MRKSLILAFCFLLLTAAAAHAADKIGVFSLNVVASQSDVSKAIASRLKGRFDPKEQALLKERDNLANLAKAITPTSPDSKKQEAMKAQEAYVKKADALYKEIQTAQGEANREAEAVLNEATAAFAKRNGYKLLISSEATPYFDPSMDVTNDILKEMNSIYAKKKK